MRDFRACGGDRARASAEVAGVSPVRCRRRRASSGSALRRLRSEPLRPRRHRRDRCGHLRDPCLGRRLRLRLGFGLRRHGPAASGSRGSTAALPAAPAMLLVRAHVAHRPAPVAARPPAPSCTGRRRRARSGSGSHRVRAPSATGLGRQGPPRVPARTAPGRSRFGLGLLEGAPHRVDDPVVGGAGPCRAVRLRPPARSPRGARLPNRNRSRPGPARPRPRARPPQRRSRPRRGPGGTRPIRTRPRPARSRRSDRSSSFRPPCVSAAARGAGGRARRASAGLRARDCPTRARPTLERAPRPPGRALGPRRPIGQVDTRVESCLERRRWDLNPRLVAQHTISSRADSAALALLRDCSLVRLTAPPGADGPQSRQP